VSKRENFYAYERQTTPQNGNFFFLQKKRKEKKRKEKEECLPLE